MMWFKVTVSEWKHLLLAKGREDTHHIQVITLPGLNNKMGDPIEFES